MVTKTYQLQNPNGHYLEVNIRAYFAEINAKLVTRTNNGVENLEIPGVGSIFYIHHQNPPRVQDESGKFLGFCTDQIEITGFDESSLGFHNAKATLEATLSEYLITSPSFNKKADLKTP